MPHDSNVAVDTQVWFRSSKWISSVAGISKILCTSEVARQRNSYICENVICGWAQTFCAWCVMKDRKMCGFNWQKPQMIISAKLQSSRVRHQYGIFGGKSQTRNATRARSEEGCCFRRLLQSVVQIISYSMFVNCQLVLPPACWDSLTLLCSIWITLSQHY